ncbi:hypothetical protein L6164_015378 [Bauhinia variegata]|uniref:Uncharacterized protein n=1 Tax=Bauhinia variegata TaxID=167791 RepID=A0ACB9NMG1_BAUVA|nr:hypothetical protein L6164_015378 [Bauhinia variegata]
MNPDETKCSNGRMPRRERKWARLFNHALSRLHRAKVTARCNTTSGFGFLKELGYSCCENNEMTMGPLSEDEFLLAGDRRALMSCNSRMLCICFLRVCHPNIDWKENVCLNILREDWKHGLNINTIIYGLFHL